MNRYSFFLNIGYEHIKDVISLKTKTKNLLVSRRNNTSQAYYSNQLYHEVGNSNDIYKGSVIHDEKCSFL